MMGPEYNFGNNGEQVDTGKLQEKKRRFGEKLFGFLGKEKVEQKEPEVEETVEVKEGEDQFDPREIIEQIYSDPKTWTKENAQRVLMMPGMSAEKAEEFLGKYNDGDSLPALYDEAREYLAKGAGEAEEEEEVQASAADFGEMETGKIEIAAEPENVIVEAGEEEDFENDVDDDPKEKWRLAVENIGREEELAAVKDKLERRPTLKKVLIGTAATLAAGGVFTAAFFGVNKLLDKFGATKVEAEAEDANMPPEVPDYDLSEILAQQKAAEAGAEEEAKSILDDERLSTYDLDKVYEEMDMLELGRAAKERYFDEDGATVNEKGIKENLKGYHGENGKKSSDVAFNIGTGSIEGMTKEQIVDMMMPRLANDSLVLNSTAIGLKPILKGAGVSEDIINIEDMEELAEALDEIMDEELNLKLLGSAYATLVNKDTTFSEEEVTRKVKTFGIVEKEETVEGQTILKRVLKVFNASRNKISQIVVKLFSNGQVVDSVHLNEYCGLQVDSANELDSSAKIDITATEEDDDTVIVELKTEDTENETKTKTQTTDEGTDGGGGGGGTPPAGEKKEEKDGENLINELGENLDAEGLGENVVYVGNGGYTPGYQEENGAFVGLGEAGKVNTVGDSKGTIIIDESNSLTDTAGSLTGNPLNNHTPPATGGGSGIPAVSGVPASDTPAANYTPPVIQDYTDVDRYDAL